MSEGRNIVKRKIDSNSSLDSLLDFKNVKSSAEVFTVNVSRNSKIEKKDFDWNAFVSHVLPDRTNLEKEKISKHTDFEGTNIINPWTQTASFSSRLSKKTKDFVILEMVIDSEQKIIEEREFDISTFVGLETEEGKFYKVNCYQRPREQRLAIIDGTGIVHSGDFPNVDFDSYSDDDLFF